MDLLSTLAQCLDQASLKGLKADVEFAVTILSSITIHLNSRIQDGSRKTVIRKEGSGKEKELNESLGEYSVRITNDDTYDASTKKDEIHLNYYENVSVMPDNIGEDPEQSDKKEDKVQKLSVIMFGSNTSLDKPIELVHDERNVLGEDICETFTILSPKEQLFIQNSWTKLCQLASSVPTVSGHYSLPCEFCHFTTTNRKNPMSELRLHRINTHFLCDLCGARHATKPGLKKHLVIIHKRNSRSFVCGIDSCTFQIAQDYNLRKLYRHVRIQHMDYLSACRVCKKTFDKLRNLRRHESEVHNVGTHSRAKKKMCLHCGYSTTGSNMSIHVRNMHTILPTLKCSSCNFETRHGNKRLKKHEQLHFVEKVKCDMCEYATRVKESMLKHQKKVHEKEEVYMCSSCSYKTPNRTSLSRHEQSHSLEKPYLCDQCDFKTKTANSLKVHSLYHQDPKFLCDLCDYKSCSSANLHTHKVVKHGTVKHECHQCGKRFNYKRHLLRHQANHEGVIMQCNECDMQFYRNDKLKEHLSNIHHISEQKSSMLTSKLEDTPLQQRSTKNNENISRSHICPDCPKTFSCSKHLSRHKNSVHSAVELACQFCHKSFSRKDKLNIHTSFSCKLRI